ncbi:hypothetical protein [Bordetella bronchiseptica]|uniref:hypothetical protein n=1 Tax=Bordetella bronchiseptica TaxID=518 RepID=UPI00067D7FDC|nr:hypothetical protein [Bordetella bronchiseptica]
MTVQVLTHRKKHSHMRTRLSFLPSLIAAAGIITPFSAHAGCADGAKEVFFCQASKGRIIQVCDAGATIEYTFGKPLKPDIMLAAARSAVTTRQWAGMGPMSYDVRVPNGNTTYTVFWSFDRDPSHEPDAGVIVEVNRKHVATVQCLPTKSIRNGMEDINLPRSE